jgi:hypothetical protein
MEVYPDLMDSWIRHCITLNHEAKLKQYASGFFKYQPGTILMVHLDLGKTPKSFQKVRRGYEYLAQFVSYKNGNVLVQLLNKTLAPEQKILEVPIYYTRFVAQSKNKIPQAILNAFNRKNIDLTTANATTRPGD